VEAQRYYLPKMRLLVSICAELSCRSDSFFLSCRDAGLMIDKDFKTASRWMKKLEADEVLVRISTGSRKEHKANEYRFNRK